LAGIACYVAYRTEGREKKHVIMRPEYIRDLTEAMKINGLVKSYNPIFEITDKIKYNHKTIFNSTRALGIAKSGYAGIGLKMMEIGK